MVLLQLMTKKCDKRKLIKISICIFVCIVMSISFRHVHYLQKMCKEHQKQGICPIGKTELEQDNYSVMFLSEVSKQIKTLPLNASKSYEQNQTYISGKEMNLCQICPPGLKGRIKLLLSPNNVSDIDELGKIFPDVKMGGHGNPSKCISRDRVAIIVPYRNRSDHLKTFLYHIHKLLNRQQLDYRIYIIEQNGDGPFNRAMLLNVGAQIALNQSKYDCFVFHDVDLLPEDDRILYSCPAQPRHLNTYTDKYKNYNDGLMYDNYFGGVTAMTVEHFKLVNGFSNRFWGWGGEDDDMANRIFGNNLYISRYPSTIARYKSLRHESNAPKGNPDRVRLLQDSNKRSKKEGYSSLKYDLVNFRLLHLYTYVLVDLEKP